MSQIVYGRQQPSGQVEGDYPNQENLLSAPLEHIQDGATLAIHDHLDEHGDTISVVAPTFVSNHEDEKDEYSKEKEILPSYKVATQDVEFGEEEIDEKQILMAQAQDKELTPNEAFKWNVEGDQSPCE